VSNSLNSRHNSGLQTARNSTHEQGSTARAGIWITLVATIVTVSALEHLTRLPWFAIYPLALIAGLLITAGYIQLKSFIFRK
jgi:hypothetical protein